MDRLPQNSTLRLPHFPFPQRNYIWTQMAQHRTPSLYISFPGIPRWVEFPQPRREENNMWLFGNSDRCHYRIRHAPSESVQFYIAFDRDIGAFFMKTMVPEASSGIKTHLRGAALKLTEVVFFTDDDGFYTHVVRTSLHGRFYTICELTVNYGYPRIEPSVDQLIIREDREAEDSSKKVVVKKE